MRELPPLRTFTSSASVILVSMRPSVCNLVSPLRCTSPASVSIFADHLVIGVRSQFQLEVLRERYSDNFQFGFLGHVRADVQVWHPESFAMVVGITP